MMELSAQTNELIQRLQDQILARVERRLGPLPDGIVHAFRTCPRHAFVRRFRSAHGTQWITVEQSEIHLYLDQIYRDQPLIIWGDSRALSTISQPSFVLYLLKLLDLQPGDRVYELGTGSGWNAALMGKICAPGPVYSYEIIPELASSASDRMHRFGLNNVHVIAGDGMDIPSGLAFNRGIFTAGAEDLPRCLYTAMAEGSRLLFVFQEPGQTDLLLVLKKEGGEFHSQQMIECGFVPVTGPYGASETDSLQPLTRSLGQARSVRILPADSPVIAGQDQVILRRKQSQFVWTF